MRLPQNTTLRNLLWVQRSILPVPVLEPTMLDDCYYEPGDTFEMVSWAPRYWWVKYL
ncbi:hypothetical protein DFR67_114146 [Williamsia limnetica]|uniref:Uncharacterized protein n=1 Tax=Williamsia limnetica TaxID=882452 RepID=A0A318RWC8_WILLI|nr:hypothetical protein [Williamsia limnetica]PYE14047.1 hypothetical protein DFR67_114146 [Williamsia limnetica]